MAVATKYEEWMELGEITEETPIEWYEEEHARAILVSEIDRQKICQRKKHLIFSPN